MVHSILLVDDDDVTLYIGDLAIKRNNFASEVIKMQEAEDALEYLAGLSEKELPEIIFLDINMPLMNGWEFLDEFEKLFLNKSEKPKIIMLTSSIDPVDKEKSKMYDSVIKFMSKPLTSDKIESLKQHEAFKQNFSV